MKYLFHSLLVCSVSFLLLLKPTLILAAIDTSVVAEKMKTAAVPFIENVGQLDENVSFSARTLGGTLFVTKQGELLYNFPKIEVTSSKQETNEKETKQSGGIVLKEHFLNTRVKSVQAVREAVAKISYFKGNDPSKWQRGIKTFEEVSLGEVYDGIEVRLKAYGNNVEKLFYVNPGADPALIKLAVTGADNLELLDTGELQATTSLGNISFTKPVAWQEIGGKRLSVQVQYDIISNEGEFAYTFQLSEYDKTSSLIIDPLIASTFLGGRREIEYGYSITLDSTGNVYVTGNSSSPNYPTTPGAYDQSYNSRNRYVGQMDIVISKLSPDLSTLLASTYLGGRYSDDGYSVILDSTGNVYVTGKSESPDYPTTPGAYDQTYKGSGYASTTTDDIVISKLSSDLSTLLASTYLGGTNNEYGCSITLDSTGNVYVTGASRSPDYPTTPGAYDQSIDGGNRVISKLSPDLSTLLASTFLGGGYSDQGNFITLDSTGNVYVTGFSSSSDYPTTPGAYDQTYNGRGDIVISKLSSDLSTLLASTFLGGESGEGGLSITLDSTGNVYVTGRSSSADYPTTPGAYDQTYKDSGNWRYDIVISKLSPDLSTLLASTYLGGTSDDYASSITLDRTGNVYMTGYSFSSDYPTTYEAYDQTYNDRSDIVISKLSPDLSTLLASTYLGGTHFEYGYSITLDSTGNVYVIGASWSPDYPTTPGAYDQSKNGGSYDIVISKFSPDLSGYLRPGIYTPSPYILLLKKKKN